MNVKVIVGVILIALGILGLVFGGFSFTERKEVLDLGIIKADATTEKRFPIPPLVSGLILVSGVVILVLSNRKSIV